LKNRDHRDDVRGAYAPARVVSEGAEPGTRGRVRSPN